MNNITTTNLADFRIREKRMAAELLLAMCDQGLPENFYEEEVTVMFDSGYVFLTNSEFQVAMLNGEDLEIWHSLPYSGQEGFADELKDLDLDDLEQDDIDYLVQSGIIEAQEEDCED